MYRPEVPATLYPLCACSAHSEASVGAGSKSRPPLLLSSSAPTPCQLQPGADFLLGAPGAS